MEAFIMKASVLDTELSGDDVEFVIQQCDKVLNLDSAQARFRVQAGLILGNLLIIAKNWTIADRVFAKTIKLFTRLVTWSLSPSDQEWLLRKVSISLPSIATFAALYAAESKESPAEEVALVSLQRVETCRGMLAKLIFQSKLNVERFRAKDESAAKEYSSLLKQLTLFETAESNEQSRIGGNDNVRRANVIQRRAHIARRISELENAFGIKPEDIDVHTLKSLAGQSALVQVVMESNTAIAFLVTDTGLRSIKLEELNALDVVNTHDVLYGKCRLSKAKPLGVAKAGRDLGEILRWLWDKAVKPILLELGYYPRVRGCHSKQLPRLWWCASGLVSQLPFHAAGEGLEDGTKENVYDYAVCSYTTSFTALKMAQACTAPWDKVLNDGMLVVGMPTTPGSDFTRLKAKEESRSIKDAAGLMPTYIANPRKVDVVEKLTEHSIVHFVCHATSIAHNPSSSAIVLGEQGASAAEYLTVRELKTIGLEKPRLVYLSACSTAENSNIKLNDESIHVASALQLAGFPHVIATLWEVKDRASIPLAGLFYKDLMAAIAATGTRETNHDVVPYALHEALCEMRKSKSCRNPLCWAPFVHMGA
ncbi:MAG: hypothetical protein Q9184_000658 [Pyrenodesmia sp. 2 TL-2023]